MKALYFMGGNYKSIGNTRPVAEFNFSMDPESVFVVLDRIKNLPVFAVPWETCYKDCVITYKWREEVFLVKLTLQPSNS
uniref:Inosineuridine preferring nucleoside hydrolaselike [Bombus impatiens] n=1 Tax=Lepeophtheirus salmonis TaxID=72036 RepID=A0A0K2T5L8_LEPSM